MSGPPGPAPRRRARKFAIASLAACVAFCALGAWQIARRAGKLELIERVEARVRAAPVDAPGPEAWQLVNAARDEYRHVRASGTFLVDRQTLVEASTALGTGYWVITPLRTAGDAVVLVNRGFLPRDAGAAGAPAPPGGATSVTGLLRITEPGGRVLRLNDPASDRWYSRDVAAIAAARGLEHPAPYFIDADAAPAPASPASAEPGGAAVPAAGLTVTSFSNNHLAYAITWFALAALSGWGAAQFLRDERNERDRAQGAGA